MNFNTQYNFPQNLAFLLSAYSNLSQNLLPSSTHTQPSLYQDLYQKQALLDLTFKKADSVSTQSDMSLRHDGSPGSFRSIGISNSGMEDESEIRTNIQFKKPIFKITRQNKLAKNVEMDQPEEKVAPSSNYNRKEKSLGELSKRFLTMFGRINDCIISLDTVTKQLDVERRRVYDIINILESLGVVYRKGKNNYQWSGLQPIRHTIEKLETNRDIKQEDNGSQSDDDMSDENAIDQRLANKKEKSLAYLAGSFIKLFFTWKQTIPLEEAAWKLSSTDIDEHKIKTKIRRLYDIANVFSSLGLIKKICLDSKKPAFKWIGNPGLDEFIKKLNSSVPKPVMTPEKNLKKKLAKDLSPVQKSPEKSCQPMSGLENSSLLKNAVTPSAKQEMLNNFLTMVFDLCQPETQPTRFVQSNSYSPLIEQQNLRASNASRQNYDFDQISNLMQLQRNLEEAKSMQMQMAAAPIVQKLEFVNPTTTDRKRSVNVEKLVFKENNNNINTKRPAPQSVGQFEVRTVKKINPVSPSHEKTIVKSLVFNQKDNFSFETKVEN